MEKPELQKLITVFLVLAVLASSLIWIFSTNNYSNPPTIQQTNSQPLALNQNAFVENLPATGNLNSPLMETNGGQTTADNNPTNLTQAFAKTLTGQVIENNPELQLDQNSQIESLNLPTDSSVQTMVEQMLASNKLAVNEIVRIEDLKIESQYAPADVSYYSQSVAQIIQDTSSAILGLANQSSTTETLADFQSAINGATEKLSSLSVPRPLAELHRRLLILFLNQKKTLAMIADYQTDPLKSVLALKSENKIISRDMENFQGEIINLKQKPLSFSNDPEWLKLTRELFGINKAYALIVFDPTNLANGVLRLGELLNIHISDIASWLYDTALEIAKNVLINEFQNEVVNWIAGNGQPLFITNWKQFLANTANVALGNAIYEISPHLCTGIGPLIGVVLTPPALAVTPIKCTLNQVINNVQNFYDNFQNGGWVAYAYSMQPQNNIFGGIIEAHDFALRKVLEETTAANEEAKANSGYLPSRECVKSHPEYEDPENPTPVGPTKTICDEWKTLTPGAAVAHALNSSIDWKVEHIISAKRFEALVTAIVDAAVTRMIKLGLSNLTAANNPKPFTGSASLPAGVASPASLSGLKTSAKSLVDAVSQTGAFDTAQSVVNIDNQWLNLQSQTIPLLNNVAAACLSSGAQSKINQLNQLRPQVLNEIAAISLATSQGFKDQIDSATSTAAISAITSQLQTFNTNNLQSSLTAAQARLANLQTLNQNAKTDLAPDTQCSISL